MNIEYYREYSVHLGREMEFKSYGHAGLPVLAIPCQGGRFFEFEDMGMLGIYAPYIESGKIRVFTIDSLDYETYRGQGECRARLERHESWINYIVKELVPRIREITGFSDRMMVTGISLGAFHAATLFFRFPDIFGKLLSLSGAYTNEYFFGGYHDDLTYENSPEQFLSNMPLDHPYIEKYRNSDIILCVGEGAWENETLDSTRRMYDILKRLDVGAKVEFWGPEYNHDWDKWFIEADHYLKELFGQA